MNLTKFSVESPLQIENGDNHLNYELLKNVEQLKEFDVILFWGDFLHWIRYAKHDFLIRERQRSKHLSDNEIIDKWYKLLLLENSPELQSRSIIFGSTLYGLNSLDLIDSRYISAIKSLYTNAKLIMMRDIMSTNFISQLINKTNINLGCDCALFLELKNLENKKANISDNYIITSFARSDGNLVLLSFANLLARISNKKMINIPWLDNSGIKGLKEKINLIRGADFVLTDIYHLSVTALREHTPTLCFGKGASIIETSLSDKKKEIFFAQHYAFANYIYFESVYKAIISNKLSKKLATDLLDLLLNDNSNNFIFNNLDTHIEKTKNNLIKALQSSR